MDLLDEDGEDSIIDLMSKLLLNTTQRMRETEAAVMSVWQMDGNLQLPKLIKQATVAYSKRTKGNPQHTEGSPHLHAWCPIPEFLRDLDGIGPHYKAALTAYCKELDDSTMEDTAQKVRCCRMKVNYTKGAIGSKVRLQLCLQGTVAYDYEGQKFEMTLHAIIRKALHVMGAQESIGTAPPTANERKLVKMLEKRR